LELAQYREAQVFTQFGAEVDEATQFLLKRGRIFTELLKQPQFSPVSIESQILSIFVAVEGHLDDVASTRILELERALQNYIRKKPYFYTVI
jgi:F0F1-type ATP synthase alpha subunit